MAKVRDVVSNLVQILDMRQGEAERRVEVMHKIQAYLVEESRALLEESLDRLQGRIVADAADITWGTVAVLVSPEGTVTAKAIYGDENSDPWLARLKSEGFHVMTLDVFSSLIQTLKSEVAEGNLIPIIEFLKANARIEIPLMYPDTAPAPAAQQPSEKAISSRWEPSDFLPAPFPHPPLPRGLFRH